MNICDKSKCDGCFACSNICPKDCISMVEDIYGYIVPEIDQNKCIECGLCKKVCPAINKVESNVPSKAYASWSNNVNIRSTSSSGGVSYEISNYIIENGGIVYGASLDKQLFVKHIRVDNVEDIKKIQGSKYVQSHICDSYRDVKSDLIAGKTVVFFGTPCQIAGLKLFLPPKYKDNLYTVDIICHGVPSQKIFNDHLKYVNKNINYVSFRDVNGFALSYTTSKSDTIKKISLRDDYYLRGFMYNIFYRDSCYECSYANINRISDLTIGDFWGLGKKEFFDQNLTKGGVSLLLPNTEKGLRLVEILKSKMTIYERKVAEAVDGNSQLKQPSTISKNYYLFRKMYPKLGYINTMRLCYPKLAIRKVLKISRK